MKNLSFVVALLIILLIGSAAPPCMAADFGAEAARVVPVPGMVTMVDLGAETCIPCKMMAPIIAQLQIDYAERAAIVFIDVKKNAEAIQTFGLKAIPTQIFYDKEGNEQFRHVGFMDKDSIVAILDKMGVK